MGFKQGHEAALREQGVLGVNRPADVASDEFAEVGEQQSLNYGKPYGDPVAEANRKTAIAVGVKRAAYYASMSSPEMVAEQLAQRQKG